MIVLYGAGVVGHEMARRLKDMAELAFADNDRTKVGGEHEGIPIVTPRAAKTNWPDADWVASVLKTPYRQEILKHIEEMGVKTIPLSEILFPHRDIPPASAMLTIEKLIAGDHQSFNFLGDQICFRNNPAIKQVPAEPLEKVYFEDFYTHLDDEHYVDCGAAEGDTVTEFATQWGRKFEHITAIEPDSQNFQKLLDENSGCIDVSCYNAAVGDHDGEVNFAAMGDHTSHIDGKGGIIGLYKLDSLTWPWPPTLIKMDIEGYEKEALWGARNLIKEHSPVLAICAYHKGPDLWEIPLLIHALNPRYKLFFRRYLEATWELIYYAVPPERMVTK